MTTTRPDRSSVRTARRSSTLAPGEPQQADVRAGGDAGQPGEQVLPRNGGERIVGGALDGARAVLEQAGRIAGLLDQQAEVGVLADRLEAQGLDTELGEIGV